MDTGEYVMAILTFMTFFAVLAGPTIGVKIARKMEDQRQKQEQRMTILASLVRTSQSMTSRMSPEHVYALNLIQLVFHDEKDILEPYKKYINYLNKFAPGEEFNERVAKPLRLDLFKALAIKLGYSFDREELEELLYAPGGWDKNEIDQMEIKNLLFGLLRGTESLRILVVPPKTPNPPA